MLRYFLIGDRKDNWNSNDHKARTYSVKIPNQKGPWTKLQWKSIITIMSLTLNIRLFLWRKLLSPFTLPLGWTFLNIITFKVNVKQALESLTKKVLEDSAAIFFLAISFPLDQASCFVVNFLVATGARSFHCHFSSLAAMPVYFPHQSLVNIHSVPEVQHLPYRKLRVYLQGWKKYNLPTVMLQNVLNISKSRETVPKATVSQSLRNLELEFGSSLLSFYCNYYLFYHSKEKVSSGPGPFVPHTVQTKNEEYSTQKTWDLPVRILFRHKV